jgi:hypothetical protein
MEVGRQLGQTIVVQFHCWLVGEELKDHTIQQSALKLVVLWGGEGHRETLCD